MWSGGLVYFLCQFIQIHGIKEDWDYYPQVKEGKSKYGIVMGGTPNLFNSTDSDRLTEPGYSACIARLYAIHHGYAFTIHKDLGGLSNRTYGSCSSQQMSPWNKVILWQKYLPDVDYLIWLDLDTLINDGSFLLPITAFIPSLPLTSQYDCLPRWNGNGESSSYGTRLKYLSMNLLPGYKRKPFMFIGEDLSPRYPVNVNSAILVLRNVPRTYQFLNDVWSVGDDPNSFKFFDLNWKSKIPCSGYWGWPWEQGGIWETLSTKNEKYLSAICILSRSGQYVLNNINGEPVLPILEGKTNSKSTSRVVFAYHHSKLGGRYMLKRLMVAKYITSDLILNQCQTFVPPPYHLSKGYIS